MLFTMLGDWFNNTMAFFFVKLLDTMAYALLGVTYNIFYAVSRLNLFGAGAAGRELYDTFTSRFYNILSIIMIFVFAYQLIMLIIDPDGKEKQASTNLVKDTLISIIFVILCPTIFKYMAMFQNHVIENNTIGAIILGQNGSKNNGNAGKDISLMVFMSFYHPNDTTYSTFFDENGELRSNAVELCEKRCGSQSTCEKFRDGLAAWQNDSSMGVGTITGIKDLRHSVGETMEYMLVLSTAAAIVAAWFFVAYSIAMGTRAVKLGVLQLISPLPLILRIFPQTRKTFETWFGEMKKTYLEVFIRLAVIFFIVALIQLIPIFINVIFESNDEAGTGLTKCLATVCLILGMLQFAKDAPDLFKTLFSNGSNLFSGLNMSPKIRSHVESNPYAMKAIGAGAGALGGVAGTVGKAAYESFKANDATNSTRLGRLGKATLAGLSTVPRGLISGGAKGYKNAPTKLTRETMADTVAGGVSAGQTSLANRKFKDTEENVMNTVKKMLDPNQSFSWKQDGGEFLKKQGDLISDWATNTVKQRQLRMKSTLDRITGVSGNDVVASSTASEMSSSVESMIDQASAANKLVKDEKTAIQGKINAGETYVGKDGNNYRSMYKTQDDIMKKYNGISSSRQISSSNGITISEITTGTGKKMQLITNNATNEKTIIADDGFAYKLDASDKVISKSDNTSTLVNAQTMMAASMTNQELSQTISGATVQSISTDASTGATTSKMVTQSGQEITKVVQASGETTYKMGNMDIKLDSSGQVQSKTVTFDGNQTVDVTNVSGEQVTQRINAEVNKNSVYNIQTVYDEIDMREAQNIATALNDTAEGRRVRMSAIQEDYRNNSNSFSPEFENKKAAMEEKWKTELGAAEKLEEFLERMADPNHTMDEISATDALKLKAFKKLMDGEQKRSQLSAELKKKEKERNEAKGKKSEDKK